MTAIAFDGYTLAVDRAEFIDNQMLETSKLVILTNIKDHNYMFAGAGDVVNIAHIVEWIRGGFEGTPKFEEGQTSSRGGSIGILVNDEGKAFVVYPTGFLSPVVTPKTVDGAAYQFLAGCLACGASARYAVELAIKHRADAGFGVDYFDWRDLKTWERIDEARALFKRCFSAGERSTN